MSEISLYQISWSQSDCQEVKVNLTSFDVFLGHYWLRRLRISVSFFTMDISYVLPSLLVFHIHGGFIPVASGILCSILDKEF